MPLRERLSSERGFTLIETLVAAMILAVGLAGMVLMVSTAAHTTLRNRAREGGLALSREILESARAIPYSDLTTAQIAPKLQAQPGLGDDGAAPGYTVKRRGTVYTVDATVCSYDDPSDSSGPHDGTGFCADSPGTQSGGTLDYGTASGDGSILLGGGTPDDYKRVVTTVTWKQGGITRKLVARTLIQNPGNSNGPTITKFTTPSLTITSNSANVPFSVTTLGSPALINWSIDGTVQGSVQNPGSPWSFNWPISTLVDGPYEVSAQAYDSAGLSGFPRKLTVTLNRFAPQAPTGLRAGRTGSVVDLEWQANPERDISGYRVYRVDTSATPNTYTMVCPGTGTTPLNATVCQDRTPPATGQLTYVVAAVDRDTGGSFRNGPYSTPAQTATTNTAPNPPTNLLATTSGATTILRWTAPTVADPDPGDSIAFYRIYRDGVTYDDRYDKTGDGSTLTYTDTALDGGTHTYYVTAVDTHLAESTALGPVTK